MWADIIYKQKSIVCSDGMVLKWNSFERKFLGVRKDEIVCIKFVSLKIEGSKDVFIEFL